MARRRTGAGEAARKLNRGTYPRLWRAVCQSRPNSVRPVYLIEPLEQRQLLTAGPIIINEIMYNTSVGEPGAPGFIAENTAQEWIELYNSSASPVTLNGWHFNQGVNYTFGDVTMQGGAYLVVAADVNAFKAKYPAVSNVVGGWTGHLANSGEDLELENQLNERDDFVSYSNEGDWALRRQGPVFFTDPGNWYRGWDWTTGADGGGKSLELINTAQDNECGQNWTASIATGGTPGMPNDVAATDIAPLITNVRHSPAIPGPTDPVTVTAKLSDELATGVTATLHWRIDGAPTFSTVTMYDDGAHGDGKAGDGEYGAIIPAQAHNTYVGGSQANAPVVEFYVSASDQGGKTRTYPAPTDSIGTQGANLLYQVRDPAEAAYTGTQPIYRLVITNADWTAWNSLMSRGGGPIITGQTNISGVYSDAQMNATLIVVRPTLPGDASDAQTEVRYELGVRNRGAGTRTANPHNLQINIPHDDPLDGRTRLEFNTRNVESQVAGNALLSMAGLPAHYGAPVQIRVDGTNLAHTSVTPGSWDTYQFGAYYMFEPYGSEWASEHMPDDSDGNIYKGVWYENGDSLAYPANLNYQGSTAARYRFENGNYPHPGPYSKQNNTTADDWSDLINLTNVLNNTPTTPDASYVAAISQVINVDEWLRYVAANMLLNNGETTLATGVGDDYSMFAGKVDPRFQVLSHDLDTVLGEGDKVPATNASIFQANGIPALAKLLASPIILQRYYAVLKELAATTFSAAQINPLLDQVLGGWVPTAYIDSMKKAAADRVDGVLAQIPNTTIAAGDLAADATWTASAGPYYVSGSLNIPSGRTLTIQPGTVVYMAAGANLTVASGGRVLAQGSNSQRILISRTPGGGNWGGITVNGAVGSPETRIAYTQIEYNGTTAIHSSGGTVFLDHLTFGTNQYQYVSLDGASFVVQDSVFPAPGGAFEPLHGTGGIKAGGRGLFLRNFFGPTNGYNDVIDFTGGQRGGPIVQFIDNVLMGESDDGFDVDGTDAWVQGNIFMHAHKNGSPDTSSGVSGGEDSGNTSEVTIIDNIFYDVDQAAMAKQGNFFTLINNTIVHQTHVGGLDTAGAVICMQDNGMTEGLGMYLEGNIVYDAEALVRNQVSSIVTFNNNLMSLPWSGPGTGNSIANPLFKHVPQISETNFTSWADAQIMKDWLSLQPTSPAVDTGPNGSDKGAVVPLGVSISGEPLGTTSQTTATLSIGVNRTGYSIPTAGWPNGSGYVAYKWRLDGGAWSAETPINSPISLTGLAAGAHRVDVIGKNDAGLYQNDPALGPDAFVTSSRRWIVGAVSTPPSPVINEVLARNISFDHNGAKPDMIELYNPGPGIADLSGMSISNDPNATPDQRFTFPSDTFLGDGQYLVLYADTAVVPGEYHLGFALRGEGGTITLYNSPVNGGAVADTVTFGVQPEDLSIGRRADGTWGLTKPTFGSANIPVGLGDPAKVKINEWLADEDVLFANDFVELYNTDTLPVDISGMYLTDMPVDMAHMAQFAPTDAAAYRIAPLSFIAANGYRSFTADGDLSQGADHANFKLDQLLGMIGLFDPSLKLVDQVIYQPQIVDVSQGRTPLGASTLTYETIPTPGIENTGITKTTQGTTTNTTLIDYGASWRYNQTANLDGTNWYLPGYSDTGWPSGPGGLYVEGNPLGGGTVPKGTPLTLGRLTYYFRTTFNFAGSPSSFTNLKLYMCVDDGAVVYLNGHEIRRENFSKYPYPTAITYSTLADDHESSSISGPYDVPLTYLHTGVNYLAAEVHQVNSTSSDIVWAGKLVGVSGNTQEVILRQVDIPANIANIENSLRVSEVMYDPIGGSEYEYIELKNTGTTALDLTGVRIGGGTDFTFPAYTLAAGDYVVVAANKLAFQSRYPNVNNVVGDLAGPLNNSGDSLILRLPSPYEAAALRFSYKPSWYASTAGGGHSLVIIDPTARQNTWSAKSSWRASYNAGGSPGAIDQGAITGAVVINEVMPWTTDTTKGQWIELHNTTPSPFPVGGWYISDNQVNLGKFRIPDNTQIPANGYIVLNQFTTAGDPFGGFGDAANPNCLSAFQFNPTGGAVYLTSKLDGAPDTYRESAAIGAADQNVSFGRYIRSDGSADFVAMSQPTREDANAAPLVGPIVINELMYHPPAGGAEYIELHNITGADVNVAQWAFTAGVQYTFPDGSIVPAHGYALVIGIPVADFKAIYPAIPANVTIYSGYGTNFGALDNGGERVALGKPVAIDPPPVPMSYVLVDAVTYGDSAPWPTSADGNGPSLIRINPAQYGDDAANWTASAYAGSPGKPNADSTPPTADIVDVYPDPREGGVDAITISFSEPVTGLDVSDLSLTRSGGPNLLTNQSVSSTDGGQTWTLSGLRGLTFLAGNYSLALSAAGSGIADLAGNPLAGGASDDFLVTSTALFGSIGNDSYTLSIDGANLVIAESLSGAAPSTYTVPLDQISSLKIDGGSGDDSLTINSALPFTPVFVGATGGNALIINAGNYNFAADLSAATEHLSLSVANATVNFSASQHLENFTLGPGAKVNLAQDGGRFIRASGLTITGNGTLDLFDNDLIVQARSSDRDALLEVVRGAIATARGTNGAWLGNGITSTSARNAAGGLTGLAVMINEKLDQNNQASAIRDALDGETVDRNCVLVKYTWNGDMNVDGLVNFDDYFQINTGFLSNGAMPGYRNGDLNFDNLINFDDYFLINSAFLGQGSTVLASPPMAQSAPPAAQKSVTKPAAKPRPAHSGRASVFSRRAHRRG